MKDILEKLKTVGLEIADNRKLGMGMNIVSQPAMKYVTIIRKDDKFHINAVGTILTPTQAKRFSAELSKASYLVTTINNAIEDNL